MSLPERDAAFQCSRSGMSTERKWFSSDWTLRPLIRGKIKKKKETRTQRERENVWIIQLCAHISLLRFAAQVTYIQYTPLRTIANDICCLPPGYDVTSLHMYYETCLTDKHLCI